MELTNLVILTSIIKSSPAEQPTVVSMASFQSMISSMALYSHLAQLGLPPIAGSSSQAADPVTMSNSKQFPSTSQITDLQRPGMSNLLQSSAATTVLFSKLQESLAMSVSFGSRLNLEKRPPVGFNSVQDQGTKDRRCKYCDNIYVI